MTKGHTFHLREDQRAELKQAFDVFDIQGTGLISVKDLRVAFRALGFEPSKQELTRLLNSVAKKNANSEQNRASDSIDFTEFVQIMIAKMSEKDPRDHVKAAFQLFKGSNNLVSLTDLRRVSSEIGENMSEEELVEMIKEADKNEDGFINEEEFIAIVSRLT